VDTATGHLNSAFFREYLGDVPIRPTPSAKFLHKFKVRLKAEARRFFRQCVQNLFQGGIHD
jgi:hypothetical protein